MKKKTILIVVLFIHSFLFAQQIKHTVSPKETLYGLSKTYNVSIENLRKANPILNSRGLQIGDVLIIPDSSSFIEPTKEKEKEKEKEKISKNPTPPPTVDYLEVVIESKQTLYRLSKKYSTTVEDIKSLNPQLESKGLKVGDVIKIPKKNKAVVIELTNKQKTDSDKGKSSTTTTEKKSVKDGLNIVMFLPFHTETIGPHVERDIAIQFFTGVKLALDSLTNNGKKINLKLFDSGDQTKLNETLNTYNFSSTNLIIGPLFKSDILTVVNKLDSKIPIVSPFSSTDELDLYSNLILYSTKDATLAEKLVNEIVKKYTNEKIYIVHDAAHLEVANYMRTLILTNKKTATVILTNNPNDINLEQNLVTNEFNKVYSVLLSDQEKFITNFLEHLVKINKPSNMQTVSLYYSPQFDSNKYMNLLLESSLIYSDTKYVNETGFNEQKTINTYKKKYCNTLDKYAVMGFDVTYDILQRLGSKGTLSETLMKVEGKQLSNKYSFLRVKRNGAWSNQGARIIQLLK